jgi:mitochondrial chaperone BCS1
MIGMSLHSLRHLDYAPGNDTAAPGIAHLPTSILDAFIPGYSFISKYVLDVFGFDISIIVSVLVLGFACTTGVHYIYHHLWASFLTYFTASVVIDAYDIIYDNLMSWAAEQEDLKRVRSLKVQSADYTDDVDELKTDENAEDGAIFNFNSWAAKVPPRYEPDHGYHWFRHKGHWFKFSREKEKVQGGWMGMMIQDQETVRITVLGRSTQPIKELILDTRDRNLSKRTAKTTIRRPSPKEQRGRGRQAWSKVAVRPSRPMSTVVLNDEQKAAILLDINEFLDPLTSKWYSGRGIPYRRGYLLHGPPGTGKSSLSFALAGVFGLDIYCMSLSEKTLSEEDLILLFNSLPKRCIVLLEDIDSAGVVTKRETEKADEEKAQKKAKEKEEKDKDKDGEKKDDSETTASMIVKEVAKAVKSANDSGDRPSGGRSGGNTDMGITMSGLLNAIDGVASSEGRVLIMTTNYPEKLDDALIRPGRVDMKVDFTLATKHQTRELFIRMYCADSREAARVPTNLREIMPDVLKAGTPADRPAISEKSAEKQSAPSRLAKLLPPTPPRTPSIDAGSRNSSASRGASSSPLDSPFSSQIQPSSELVELANLFADSLPEATFSPAEIQGYLLMRKKNPWAAVAEVTAWRDAEIVKKNEKNKEKDKKDTDKDKAEEDKKDKQDDSSKSSSTDDLVKIVKEEADSEDRGGEEPGKEDGGDEVEDGMEKLGSTPARVAETGSSALIGNADGVANGSDDDDDSNVNDANSDAENEMSSVTDSDTSQFSVGSYHGDDDCGD